MRAVYFACAFVAMGTLAAFITRSFFASTDRAAGQPSDTSEFLSGPQVDSRLPGPFRVFNINGLKAGEEDCLYCRYGGARVAMIFATKPTKEVTALLQPMDRVVAASPMSLDGEVGACLVVTENNDEIKKLLAELADREKYKKLVVGMIEPQLVKEYHLHPEAEVTVLLCRRHYVKFNRAYKAGELTETVAREVGEEAAKFLTAK
jgi:hypothetical protein